MGKAMQRARSIASHAALGGRRISAQAGKLHELREASPGGNTDRLAAHGICSAAARLATVVCFDQPEFA